MVFLFLQSKLVLLFGFGSLSADCPLPVCKEYCCSIFQLGEMTSVQSIGFVL